MPVSSKPAAAGPAQIPCAQLRFDRQRAHRGEGDSSAESGCHGAMVPLKGLDSGVKTETFCRIFFKNSHRFQDFKGTNYRPTCFFMLVLDSFLGPHLKHFS